MLKTSHLLLLLLVLLGTVTVYSFVTSYEVSRRFVDATAWVEHTYQVLYTSEQLAGRVVRIEKDCSGGFSNSPCEEAVRLSQASLAELQSLTRDNPVQQRRIDSLRRLFEQRMAALQTPASDTNHLLSQRIAQAITRLAAEENRLLAARRIINENEYAAFRSSFNLRLVITVSLLVLAVAFTVYSGRLAKRLRQRNRDVVALNKNLEASERKFRSLIEHSNDLTILIDPLSRILFCSPSSKHIICYKNNGGQTEALADKVHPEDKEKFDSLLKNLLHHTAQNLPVQLRVQNQDGGWAWLQGRCSNLLNEPTLQGLLFNLQDVTSRVEAEARIVRSEKIYRGIASCIPGSIICLVDTEERFFLIEGDFLAKAGYSKEALLGKTITEALEGTEDARFIPLWRRTLKGENIHTEAHYPGLDLDTRLTPLKDERGHVFAAMVVNTDVTNLKNTERSLAELNAGLEEKVRERTTELRSQKEFLETIINATGDTVVVFDAHLNYLSVNQRTLEGLSLRKEEMVGKNLLDVLPGLRFSELYPLLQKAKAGERVHVPGYWSESNQRWLELQFIPLKDDSGKVSNVVVIGHDITAMMDSTRRLEAANRELQNTQAFLQQLIDSSIEYITVFDKDLRFITVNKQVEDLRHITREELKGKHILDFSPQHKDTDQMKALTRALAGESVYLSTRPTPTRPDIFVDTYILPLIMNGAVEGAIMMARDVTNLVQTEQRLKAANQELQNAQAFLQQLIDSSVEYISVFDKDLKYLTVNARVEGVQGTTREQLKGRHILEISPRLKGTEELQGVLRALEGETVHLSKRAAPSRPDIYVDSYLVPLKINGTVEGVILMARDVTSVVQTEKMLEAANRELEAFSYSVSHDLRAPLRAINGYANILEEDYAQALDEEGNRLLSVVRRNALKMGALIDDLLTFSRLGKKELNRTRVNMNDVVQGIAGQLVEEGAQNETFVLHDLLPASADAAAITQVWTNLLSNAVKYSSKNPAPRIEVSSTQENESVVYSIKDNGVGFDPQYAHKLFGVFQRLHSAEEFPGTGVGLAIVQRIVHKHGGKVWAEGEPGKGATFFFSLPQQTETSNAIRHGGDPSH